MVLNQLKERGLEDILIVSTDNLPGFTQDASQKWTYRIKNWDLIRSQLSIFFEGRI